MRRVSPAMAFGEESVEYLRSRRPARLAGVAPDGQPDMVLVRLRFDGTHTYINGRDPVKTRKNRSVVTGNTKVALVNDDLVSTNLLSPRYLRVFGTAEFVDPSGLDGPRPDNAHDVDHLV